MKFIELLNNPGMMPGESQQLAIKNFPALVEKCGWSVYDGTKPHGFVVGIATYSTHDLKLLDGLVNKNLNLAVFDVARCKNKEDCPVSDLDATPFVEYHDGESLIRYEGSKAANFLLELGK